MSLGISKLTFTEDLEITHICSSEKEVVKLDEVINTAKARGQVEKWLLEIENDMVKSIHTIIQKALIAYPESVRVEWVVSWPGQIVLCITQYYWTQAVHKAIRGGQDSLAEYLQLNNDQISDIVQLVRGKLSKQNRTTLGALVVLDVHSRDVLANLVQLKVCNCLFICMYQIPRIFSNLQQQLFTKISFYNNNNNNNCPFPLKTEENTLTMFVSDITFKICIISIKRLYFLFFIV